MDAQNVTDGTHARLSPKKTARRKLTPSERIAQSEKTEKTPEMTPEKTPEKEVASPKLALVDYNLIQQDIRKQVDKAQRDIEGQPFILTAFYMKSLLFCYFG